MRVYPIEDSRPAPDRPPTSKETDVQTITPFLWFDDQAEQAAEFYVSVFPNSEILRVNRNGGGGISDPGTVMSVSLVIDGMRLEAFNGGPDHPFTEAISLFVPADSQDEIDRLWDRLLAGGGREVQCGWLKDRWGLSWQIVPTVLFELLADPDPGRAGRAVQAILGMVKLDIAALKAAPTGTSPVTRASRASASASRMAAASSCMAACCIPPP